MTLLYHCEEVIRRSNLAIRLLRYTLSLSKGSLRSLAMTLMFIALLTPLAASAHVLKTDGQIGAVMHIDPADDPVVGQSSSLFFELKDKQNKFAAEVCDCSLVISRAGKQIYTQALSPGSANTLLASYTFPERSVYQVEVLGKPSGSVNFQAFDLKYTVRVARDSAASPRGSVPLIYWLLCAAVVGFALMYVIKKGKK